MEKSKNSRSHLQGSGGVFSAIDRPPFTPSARSGAAARPGRGGPGETAIPPVKNTDAGDLTQITGIKKAH
ncbi:MAG: hypothetical protein ACOYMP_02170 [Nodosilinea sp.]